MHAQKKCVLVHGEIEKIFQKEELLLITKRYEDLKFTDDFMFCKVLTNYEDVCKDLLELILDIKIDHIEYPKSQAAFESGYDAHGIRLDVYTKDDNAVYDIEMQTTTGRDIPRRMRYYQSMIDSNQLERGVDYENLKDSYIIFICLDDIIGANMPIYRFQNICKDKNDLCLGDGAYKIILNAKGDRGRISPDMSAFLDYLIAGRPNSNLTNKIEEIIDDAKSIGKWEKDFMLYGLKERDIKMEGYQEGISQGMSQGIAQGRAQMQAEVDERDKRLAAKDREIMLLKAQLKQNN